jgi:hypothetical protein
MAIRSKSVLSLQVRSLWAAALAVAASCLIPTHTAMASVITYLVTGTQSAPLGFFSTALAIPEPLPSSLQPNESIQLNYSSYVNGILSQDQYGGIIGNITSIQPVPITAAGWLLLSGLGIFWLIPQLRTARHRPGY